MRRLLLTALPFLLTACDHPAPPPAAPRPALTIIAGESAQQSPSGIIGEIRPRFESVQGFRIAGKIVERKVEIGDAVKKGQILARLDAADTSLSAQAAQAQTRAAEADLTLAKAELERQRQLYARKFISAAALDIQEAQFKSAAARVEQSKAQAQVSGNQSRYTALVADRDGVVTFIHAEPGQVVEAGEAIARIADSHDLEVTVAVPETYMAGVATGRETQVRLWAAPEKVYHGKVREVAPAADTATRTFQAKVSILDADPQIHMGMTAGVRFIGDHNVGLLLPSSAVTQQNGQTTIWIVDKTNHVQPRHVSIGAFREDGVPVTSGLNIGERVVVAGVHTLAPGQEVRPVPSEATR